MAETEMNCVYVDTNLDTHLLLLLHDRETISDFKEKLCKEHHQCFPELGEIDISAVKVKRENTLGLLLDYHLPDSMCLSMVFEGISHNSWFVFVEAELASPDLEKLVTDLDVHTKNQNLEQDLGTKKRKLKLLDGEKNRKKAMVYLSQSGATSASASASDVDESHELRGNVEVDVTASQSPPRDKLDEATEKEIEMGEESAGRDKIETVSHTADHLDTETGPTARPDTEQKRSNDDINHSSSTAAAAVTTSSDIVNETNGVHTNVDPVEATSESLAISRGEILDLLLAEACQKDPLDATPESLPISKGENLDAEASQKGNEMGDNPIDDVGRDQTVTDNHLDTTSELTVIPDTEKISKDDINQSSAAAPTTSRDIVNEITGAPPNVDPLDTTPLSLSIPRAENLDSPFAEANQKDIDDDVGRDQSATGNLASHTADHLDTNSDLTTRPDTESKKKRRKKRSKDEINQSSVAATTTSRDTVNETNEVPAKDDATQESLPISRGISFAESSQKENEMAEKIVEDEGRDDTETNSGLMTTRSDTEKKKRRKKSSKEDYINQFFVAATASGVIVNEINGVPDAPTLESLSISRRENLGLPSAEASHKETETGEKIDDVVGGGKAAPNAVDEAKKRKSKKAKTTAEEDTLVVASDAHSVEPVKAVDGEEPDNVLASLQGKDETGKKSSKKSKKKRSVKVAESQELSVEVNNAALEENPPINNPQDTETDASLLRKFSEVADDSEDNGLSKTSLMEMADTGDNFGFSQNQVGCGDESNKE